MTEISYKNWHLLSDEAIEKEIGRYIKQIRQQRNMTQADLANAANISRSTLSLLERGSSGNLKTLIQILRVLDAIHLLEAFYYEAPLSPIQLAKAQHKVRERVRPYHKKKDKLDQKKSTW